MPNNHDASYKQLFSHPEVVRDLVLGFIPDQWLHSLDFSTLEKVPGSFITEDLRHRSSRARHTVSSTALTYVVSTRAI